MFNNHACVWSLLALTASYAVILVTQVANDQIHGDRLKELVRVECAGYVGALPVECDRLADERGLHADFLGYQLQENPFSVVHFRPQLFPDEQILGERVNHLEEAMPQPPWKTRERGASHLGDRVLARLRLCRRCQCCGLLRKQMAGIHSGRSISSKRLIPSSRNTAQLRIRTSNRRLEKLL